MVHLEQSFKRTRNTLESLAETILPLKDELVEIPDHHFERARRKIAILYPHLYLSQMNPFQMVQDGRLVDGE